MTYCYYPGCTLKNKAKNFDYYMKEILNVFDIQFEEIDEWQCCGGLYTNPSDIAKKLSAVRTLKYAHKKDMKLLTLCASCHNVLKRVNYDIKTNKKVRDTVNNYLEETDEYNGETTVVNFIELVKNDIGYDNLAKKVKNPINKKVASYYGCQLLRPSKIMNFDNSENPHIMQDIINALGGESVKFAFQNECCSSYASLTDEPNAKKHVDKIINDAKNNGAELIVTACPVCLYNLKKYSDFPVYYITEIMAECFDIKKYEEQL